MTHGPTDPGDQVEGTLAPTSLPASTAAAAFSDSATPSAPTQAPPLSKFTVLLAPDAAADFDQLALDIRRLLGRRVPKGELVRALIALAADDPMLRDQVLDELRARPIAR